MTEDVFELLEDKVRDGRPDEVFDILAQRYRAEKKYPQLFETRLMKKRRELGLPLIQTQSLGDLPDGIRQAYEDAYVAAAREVGGLYLADCDIPRAWPYFRAIGESSAVADAIEKVQPGDGIEPIIEIAFHERANPRKGFELILANYGTCSAITSFEQYPAREGRDDCIRLLINKLHGDLVESLRHAIAAREGTTPDSRHIPTLTTGREWLFEENNYHIDTSHLAAVIRFSIELTDRISLARASELAEYGAKLSPLFHYRGQPPFHDPYIDYGIFLKSLLGENVDEGVAHFRQKLKDGDADSGPPAQVLVNLLSRLNRHSEAIDVYLDYLSGAESTYLNCPNIVQLCELAGDHARLKEIARQQGDWLSYTAAMLRDAS